jgi:heat shock protein HslJ
MNMRFSLCGIPLLALAACDSSSPGASGAAASASADTVVGRTWVARDAANLADDQRPRLEFQRDGRVSGFTGCNTLGGTWRESNGLLQLGPLAVTKRFCVGPAGEWEKRFLAAVNDKARIEMASGRLVAIGASGEKVEFLEAPR